MKILHNLRSVGAMVHQNAKDKGFHSLETPVHLFISNQCNNLRGEIAELWEAHRKGELWKPCDKIGRMFELNIKPLTCMEEEMADIVIRILDVMVRFRMDPVTLVAAHYCCTSDEVKPELFHVTIKEVADAIYDIELPILCRTDKSFDVSFARMTNQLSAKVDYLWRLWETANYWTGVVGAYGQWLVSRGEPRPNRAGQTYARLLASTLFHSVRLGIDIEECVLAKHAYNTSRPHMHGKKN